MLTNATIDKLIEMKLTAMADALRIQLDDPKMNEVNFEDRFSMLVDIEYSKRKDNRLKRLIKKAEFEQPDATIAHYYKVRFVRLPDLLIELMPLVGTDAFAKALKKYTNPRLLIIDEWLLTPLDDGEAKVVFEVIHKRRKKSSTIFCSQFLDEGWYERIGGDDNPLADSIMDRIKYDAYKIKIQAIDPDHDRSMREVYGLSPEEAE